MRQAPLSMFQAAQVHAIEGDLTEHQVTRRPGRLDGSDDGSDCLRRIARLLACLIVKVLARLARGGVVIVNTLIRFDTGASEEFSAKRAGLDDGDLYTERCKLSMQRLREAFDSKLAGVVITPARRTNQTANRRQIDDVPRSLRAKMRQERTRHADQPEDIRLEDGHVLRFGRLFNRSCQTVARIVDEHIHAAKFLDCRADRCLNRRLVGHVERDCKRRLRMLCNQVIQCLRLTRRRDDLMAASQQLLCQFPAESR